MVRLIWAFVMIVSVIVGSLGYLTTLLHWSWKMEVLFTGLIVFLVLSIVQLFLKSLSEKKMSEKLYPDDNLEIFRPGSPKELIQFFKDEAGDQCAALKLRYLPKPGSVLV
ncbi:MAG: hypothetical protein NC930_06375 [Candidatus Omnitrophica bacterium]|nr:hypothetical protein [Candidatus Omnitrophota bacterium]